MEVVRQEGLVENSFIMGERLMSGLRSLKYPFIKEVRGKGLMIGFELDSQLYEEAAWDLCIKLLHKGLITKPTHG
jgi:ornithine--oxo-acid transaminase